MNIEKTGGEKKIIIKEKEYILCYDFNAICWFESNSDKSFDETVENLQKAIVEKEEKICFADIRLLLGAGLQINAVKDGIVEYKMIEIMQLISGVDPFQLTEGIMEGLD